MLRHLLFPPALIFALLLVVAPLRAQMLLPGAVGPGVTAVGKPAGSGILPLSPGRKPRKPAAAGTRTAGKPPGEETVIEHPLYQNGASGALEFVRHDKTLQIRKLVLRGEQSAKPGEVCEVNVAPTATLAATPAGMPAGLARYVVEMEACPFSFDILDESILVSSPNLTCEFKQADCQVNPSGLWGPKPATFTPARAKEIEHARTRWEAAVRDSFRDALARAKDKTEIKQVAHDQAGFSSERETQCRDYAAESTYGFCAARLTQARAFALRAKTGQLEAQHAAETVVKVGRAKKR